MCAVPFLSIVEDADFRFAFPNRPLVIGIIASSLRCIVCCSSWLPSALLLVLQCMRLVLATVEGQMRLRHPATQNWPHGSAKNNTPVRHCSILVPRVHQIQCSQRTATADFGFQTGPLGRRIRTCTSPIAPEVLRPSSQQPYVSQLSPRFRKFPI